MKSHAPLQGPMPLHGTLLAKLRGSRQDGDEHEGPAPPDEDDLPPPDPALLEALRRWRRDAADQLKAPAYAILHTTSLELIARVKPKSLDELERIKGIGPAKLDQYGQAILGLVEAHQGSADGKRRPDEVATRASHAMESLPLDERPSFYWTWRVLQAGATVAECAVIRGISPSEILDDAARALEAGLPLPPALADEIVRQAPHPLEFGG
jgi:hypothetical protein